MENEFVLSPVFCLHNGAVILAQNEMSVTVGVMDRIGAGDAEDGEELAVLKERISRAAKQAVNKKAMFVEISEEEFKKHVSGLFGRNSGRKFCLDSEGEGEKGHELKKQNDENAARALLESLVTRARSYDATDIHIEDGTVRFRVKGELKNEIPLDEASQFSLVQRIKLLAKLNVVERRLQARAR